MQRAAEYGAKGPINKKRGSQSSNAVFVEWTHRAGHSGIRADLPDLKVNLIPFNTLI